MKKLFHFLISLTLFFCLSCTSLSPRGKNIIPNLNNQNFNKAIKKIKETKNKVYSKHNRLLYYLDLGTLYHYAQKYDTSNVYLEQALEIYNDLYSRSIITQSLSTLLDSEISPYRSYNYEIIAVHQIISLNYQALKKPYESLVETRRAQLKFDTWKKESIENYHYDGSFNFLSFIYYFMINEKSNGLISLYQSVLGFNQNLTDLPNIVKQEAADLFPKYQRSNDLLTLQIPKSSQKYHSMTQKSNADSAQIIIIGYAGKGPILKDEIWSGTYSPIGILHFYHYNPETKKTKTFNLNADQLISFKNQLYSSSKEKRKSLLKTYHIKLALPKSTSQHSETQHFRITNLSNPNNTIISKTLTNYNKLSQQYLKENKTNIFIKSIIRVAFRTSVIQSIKNKIAQGNFVDFFINFFVDLTSDAIESSDTRNLFALPRTIEIACITVVAKKQILLIEPLNKDGESISKPQEYLIDLKSGETQFLFTSSFQ